MGIPYQPVSDHNMLSYILLICTELYTPYVTLKYTEHLSISLCNPDIVVHILISSASVNKMTELVPTHTLSSEEPNSSGKLLLKALQIQGESILPCLIPVSCMSGIFEGFQQTKGGHKSALVQCCHSLSLRIFQIHSGNTDTGPLG